jgi:serine/threonine protein kinase
MAMLGDESAIEDDIWGTGDDGDIWSTGNNPMFIGFGGGDTDSSSSMTSSMGEGGRQDSWQGRPTGHRLSTEKWSEMRTFTKTVRKACCVWEGMEFVDPSDTFDLFKRFQAASFDNPVILSGNVERKSRLTKKWQPRFLRVNIVESTLSYARSQNYRAKPKHTISLSALTGVQIDPVNRRRFTFTTEEDTKLTLTFQVKNEEECKFYIHKFRPLIEFVHNFGKRTNFPLQVRQSMQRPVCYRIGELLHKGQLSSVHEVINIAPAVKKCKVHVAKVFKITCADDVYHLNGVAKILNTLAKHPCIARLVDTFMTKERYYVVTENVRGGTLSHFIFDQSHGYSEMFVRQVMIQLLQAIEFIHGHSIVHLDLTLEHLLLSAIKKGVVPHTSGVSNSFYIKLVDFQHAKIIDDGKALPTHIPQVKAPERLLASSFNQHRGKVGQKPEYVPPELQDKTLVERLAFDGPHASKVDIFAAGVIFFMLMFGRHPWGNSEAEIQGRIKKGNFAFPEDALADRGDTCRSFLENMLNVDPEARLSAKALLQHPWLNGEDLSTRNVLGGWLKELPNFNL